MARTAYAISANNSSVLKINSAIVYRIIAEQGPISRIEIAQLSELAPASITKITRQLLDAKLIKEVEQTNSTGGRPPTAIVIEKYHFQSIAIHLSRGHITLELYNLAGISLAQMNVALVKKTQIAIEAQLIECIESFLKRHKKQINKLIAIAIVLPGLLDTELGIVNSMPEISIINWQLKKVITERFQLPCYIGHDVSTLALAEHYFGNTQECENSILIRIHRGIGSGIIINRQMFLSKNRHIGEIGHIQVDPLGEPCYCSNIGCLESIISNQAITNRIAHLLKQGRTSLLSLDDCSIKQLCEAVNHNDPLAIEIVQFIGHQLGKVIAILLNLLHPQKIVLAGEITCVFATLKAAMNVAINTQSLAIFHENLEIETTSLNHYSAIGAFALVKSALFSGELLADLTNKTAH